MKVELSADDLNKIKEFSQNVIARGQSNKHFYSTNLRTPNEQFEDTFRGKAGEVAVHKWCRLNGIPVSEIDFETGKGTFGKTMDCGIDLIIGRNKASINTIKSYDKWLLIPVFKYEEHKRNGIEHLILVKVDRDTESTHADIVGFISFDEFDKKKAFFGKGEYPMNLVNDNYGVFIDELSSIKNIFDKVKSTQSTISKSWS